MRILLVSDLYPPSIGGAQRQVWLLGTLLAQRGHQVCVATVAHPERPAVSVEHDVTVYRMRTALSHVPLVRREAKLAVQPPFPEPGYVWRLRQIVDTFKPDVVQAYGSLVYSCAVALIGTRVPLIVSARDYRYICAVGTLLRDGGVCAGPALRACLACAVEAYGPLKGAAAIASIGVGAALLRRRTAALHSVSSYVQRIMRRYLLRGAAMTDLVVHSFREREEARPATPAFLAQLPDQPFILFVGALERKKGVDVLLAAYQRLDAPPPLVLIGTRQPDTPAAFPPGVTVLTDVPHPDVMGAWERCLFGVLPVRWPEPFGGVVQEACSRGRAVIASSAGGHTDVIADEVSGLLVAPGDPAELAAAMRRLLGDDLLRQRLGRAARERARLFTADISLPRFEQLYEETVSAARRRPRRGTKRGQAANELSMTTDPPLR